MGLLALMNVSVTFNANLSLSDTFTIVSPLFLFLPHFVLCLIAWFIFCNMIYISLFTLCFDEIHLIGFYFVTRCFCINSYKKTHGFSQTPTANSRRRAFARKFNFSLLVSGNERTFTFCVSLVNRLLFHKFQGEGHEDMLLDEEAPGRDGSSRVW